MGVPNGTASEIVDKLNQQINAALADPKITTRLVDIASTPLVGPPAEFGKLIAEETGKWARVIKLAGIKAE